MAEVPLTIPLDRADDEAGLDYVIELVNIEIRAQNAKLPLEEQLPEFNRKTYLEHRIAIVIESYKQQWLNFLASELGRKYIAADSGKRAEAEVVLADVVLPIGAGGGGAEVEVSGK